MFTCENGVFRTKIIIFVKHKDGGKSSALQPVRLEVRKGHGRLCAEGSAVWETDGGRQERPGQDSWLSGERRD